jgi:glycosyltransferase involved in cell wall biosynthesis
MPEPLVVCVMLSSNRPLMAARAVECFRAQTYPHKRLLVWIRGDFDSRYNSLTRADGKEFMVRNAQSPVSIGTLRNEANQHALDGIAGNADIICHWDDDDWSHPQRLAEQVYRIEMCGGSATGYNQVPFWDERELCGQHETAGFTGDWPPSRIANETWLYSNADPTYCIGSSLCYRADFWRSHPFENVSAGEDFRWWAASPREFCGESALQEDGARMVCRIHDGNTSNSYRREVLQAAERKRGFKTWQRSSELDEYCRERMAL